MPPLRSTGPVPEAEHPEHAGQYRLEECLGSGGMGVVHLATSASGLRLAIKVVHAEHAMDPEFRARFRQEVTAARRVSGAFTAPVVDADPDAGRPWMATLFIDGPTLAERVKRNGPLGVGELRRVGSGLAEALRDIHRAGVVHRDLKPSNVLLASDGPKVIDFGISRPSDSDLRTETGKLIGTPPFMAPEQFQRPRDVGPAADVFAMGAVLVHAATGRGPFDSDSPYVVAYQVVHNEPDLAGVPDELVPLLGRCLAKAPEERPTPGEVMAELRAPAGDVATAFIPLQRVPEDAADARDRSRDRSPEAAAPKEGARRPRRRGVRYAVIAAALAGLLAGGYAGLRTGTGESDHAAAAAAPGVERAFAPWQATLARGADTPRTPVCSADGDALYCSAPGVLATRLATSDGAPVWSRRASAASYEGYATAPVLSGGLLHVTTPDGKRLEALDPGSGATRWSVATGSYASLGHAAGSVLLMRADGTVRALDSATGKERWRGQRGAPGTQWAPAADGSGTVFAVTPEAGGAGTLVRAVAADSGDVRWEKRLSGVLSPVTPAASGDALFLLAADTADFTNAVVRLDTATRAVRRVPLPVDVDQAQAAADGDTVYLVGTGGSLLAVDTADGGGTQRWRLETYLARASRPVVDGGRVYLSGADGRLLAVDAGRGVQLGQTEPRMGGGGSAYAATLPAPVADEGRVFGAAPDGSVFAVEAGDPSDW
ncbi:serine/threonine-protein kinase [Streptomyces formicae]|uniref:PQQ-binding-like beta-propeller repeat protein n=1 Tax=Streptomyces formicae TaxID=1616117 RepID=A0ABY3WJ61_9ACTN|nr:serine/threonine-protein kinase [Streptomyces formicae]UNM10581.1 PQQ-binding-like beta-propeller repeat protein [Streptomyces formicae]